VSEEKKLIIDEDWKTQVEAEKRQSHQEPPAAERGEADAPEMQMPPASFEMLLTTLATEALMAMGQMPHPLTGQIEVQRDQAKYLIDTIDVLREKTQGNLSPDEQQMVEMILHQLRLAFVQTPAAAKPNLAE
jgi:hypothetical protein